MDMALLCAALVARGATEGPYTYTVADGEATITAFDTSWSGPLTIADTLGGCAVTAIGAGGFISCSGLTEVILPDSVGSVDLWAFLSCAGLTNVVVGAGVTNIGDTVWGNCTGLGEVTIPDTVASMGHGVFGGCSALTNATLGAGIRSMGEEVFYGCPLTSLALRNDLAEVDLDLAVGEALPRVRALSVGDGAPTAIGNAAFAGWSGLRTVTVGAGVTNIGDQAFMHCSALTNVVLGSRVRTIGEYAFHNCTGLTRVTIPENVTTIGNSAFYDCPSLASVTIGGGVASMADYAFAQCPGLGTVYFAGPPPASVGTNTFWNTPATLYYLPAFAADWPPVHAGRPTHVWNPAFAALCPGGQIALTVTGTPPLPVALEATTNLAAGPWVRLCTTNLTAGTLILADPAAAGLPARFYRLVGP